MQRTKKSTLISEAYRDTVLIPFLIMLASMTIRALYVSYISIYQNQHDGGIPYSGGGHLGYITWFLTEKRLPDFDVRTADQFELSGLYTLQPMEILKLHSFCPMHT